LGRSNYNHPDRDMDYLVKKGKIKYHEYKKYNIR